MIREIDSKIALYNQLVDDLALALVDAKRKGAPKTLMITSESCRLMTLTVGIRCDIIFTVIARAGSSVYMHCPTSNPESAQMDNVAANTYCRFRFQYWSLGTETACSIISAYVAVFYMRFLSVPVCLLS